ncbi:MAG: tRNA pseudouridine(55) synthase TruB [Solirubrobacteraceae bacterium]
MNRDGAPGILLADKPAGITSHDMVARARRALGVARVGHAGTLDPFATGLLIVLVGRATRLARFFTPLPKAYEVEVQLGATSTTGDPEGEIVHTGRVPATLALPLGTVHQRPPAHSAVKIDGERAYLRARRGEDVQTSEREVTVFESSVLWRDGDRAALRFVCSSGTYVRSLVADLGDAYCLALRRLAIGPFAAQGAWPGEGVAAPAQIAAAWGRFGETVVLDDLEADAVAHGRAIAGRGLSGPVLLTDAAGQAVAVAGERDGALRVQVGLRGQ